MVVLVCPVRGCRRPLARGEGRLACRRGHSFDVARSGYVNLLQPQERQSARPGDSVAIRGARRRFQARGFETPLMDAVAGLLSLAPTEAVLDVGCGEGVMRDRVADVVESFAPLFALARRERLRRLAHFDAEAVRDAMVGSYRGLRASQRGRLASLGDLDVTLSRDALLFRPSAPRSRRGTRSRR